MKRLELYLNSKNRPVIDVYNEISSEFPDAKIDRYHALDKIDEICTYKIQSISVLQDDIILRYNGFALYIREYKEVFKLNEMKQMKNIISKCYNHLNQKQIKKKKVQRKNKHIGAKLIATTIVLSLIGTCAVSAHQKMENGKEAPVTEYSIIEETTTSEKIIIEEPETTEIKVLEEAVPEEESQTITLDYIDRSNTPKAKTTVVNYRETINKYAEMYGLDTELMLAIATQERGIHSEKMDPGGATGIMQVQNSIWKNQRLTAYNYQSKVYETIIVEESRLSDVYYNIKIGCMIFQNTLKYMDYNVIAAVQCYNFGYGNMMKVLTAYSEEADKSIEEILKNKEDTGWLKYRSLINQGDVEYAEHVCSWLPPEDEINILNQEEEIRMTISGSYKQK